MKLPILIIISFFFVIGSHAQTYLSSLPENEPITSYPTGVSYQTGPGANNSVKQWAYPYGIKLSLHHNVARNFEIMTTDKDGKLAFRQFNQNTNNWTQWKVLFDDSQDYLYSQKFQIRPPSTGSWFNILSLNGSNRLDVVANSNTLMSIKSNGNVGINTTDTKGHMLAVKGDIVAEEVLVALYNDWPDYVFEQDYQLMTVEELDEFIQQNKHLPNVPSAEEVSEKGFSLGEMDAKLLEKVEELTLYVIELKKELNKAKKNIEELKKR